MEDRSINSQLGVRSSVESGKDPFCEANWGKLLPKVQATLNQLALLGYRQAPALQQAMAAMKQAVRCAKRNQIDQAWCHLAISTRAAQESTQISQSPMIVAERGADCAYKIRHAGLGRAIAYLSLSAQSCESYLVAPHPAKLERAISRLEDAAITVAGTLLIGL